MDEVQGKPDRRRAALRERLVEILTEFGERAHQAEEGIAVTPPPDEVNRAVDAILEALAVR